MIKNQQLHTEHDTLHPTQVSISKKKRSEHRRQTDENLDNVYPRVLKYLIYLSLKEAEKHDKVLF